MNSQHVRSHVLISHIFCESVVVNLQEEQEIRRFPSSSRVFSLICTLFAGVCVGVRPCVGQCLEDQSNDGRIRG